MLAYRTHSSNVDIAKYATEAQTKMPTPRRNERRQTFLSRCIRELREEGKPGNVAIAQCINIFDSAKKKDEEFKGFEQTVEKPSHIRPLNADGTCPSGFVRRGNQCVRRQR